MNRSISTFAISTAAFLAGCAAPATKPVAVASVSGAPVGRLHGYVVGRRHSDFAWRDGKEYRYEVEYGWDYDQGIALRKTFDEGGALLKTQRVKGEEPPLTESERERVKALVRGQPELKRLVEKPGVVVWAGGFIYRRLDDRYCGDKTRCIHAIASADNGNAAVAHSIVDLQSDRVVYPFYRPADEKTAIKPEGE